MEVIKADRVNGIEFIIEGEVGSEVDGGEIIRHLRNFHGEEVTFTIFSGGGSVFHALAVYEYIRANNIKATANVYGLAASSATIFAAAAGRERTFISPHSQFMVHAPYGGDKKALKQVYNAMVKIYMDVTGMKRSQIEDLLAQDSFLDAKTAQKMGFGIVMKDMAIAAHYKNKNQINQDMSEETTPVEESTTEALSAQEKVSVGFSDYIRGHVLIESNPDLTEVKGTIDELITNIKASEAEISDLKSIVEAKDEAIAGLEASIAEKDEAIATFNSEKEAEGVKVTDLEATIAELKAEVEKLSAEPAVEQAVEPATSGPVTPAEEQKELTPVDAAEARRQENLRLHQERYGKKHLK